MVIAWLVTLTLAMVYAFYAIWGHANQGHPPYVEEDGADPQDDSRQV